MDVKTLINELKKQNQDSDIYTYDAEIGLVPITEVERKTKSKYDKKTKAMIKEQIVYLITGTNG